LKLSKLSWLMLTLGLFIIGFASLGVVRSQQTGINCSVLPLTASVEGDVPNLLRFITKLNDDFITGFVKSVGMNIPEAAEDSGETAEESAEGQSGELEEVERASANISLVIYAYQGD